MILQFGKYKGQTLADVPSGYLDWLREQDWVKPDLMDAVEEEWQIRERSYSHFWGEEPP